MPNVYHSLRAQGATEYLVLLAVVLVIALVSIAILGFFPGMASDAQITESQLYWRSATPLAIVETGGMYAQPGQPEYEFVYVRIRNTGSYPIRLSSITASGAVSPLYNYFDPSNPPTTWHAFDTITLAPGEEVCFGSPWIPGKTCQEHSIEFGPTSWGPSGFGVLNVIELGAGCDSQGRGALALKDFSFAYTEYADSIPITKRQTGSKPLIIKCAGLSG